MIELLSSSNYHDSKLFGAGPAILEVVRQVALLAEHNCYVLKLRGAPATGPPPPGAAVEPPLVTIGDMLDSLDHGKLDEVLGMAMAARFEEDTAVNAKMVFHVLQILVLGYKEANAGAADGADSDTSSTASNESTAPEYQELQLTASRTRVAEALQKMFTEYRGAPALPAIDRRR
jgi:hypothetical protein